MVDLGRLVETNLSKFELEEAESDGWKPDGKQISTPSV